jgi:tetratricopeptide (TPR) repeat protein
MLRTGLAIAMLAAVASAPRADTGVPEKAKALAERGRQLQHAANYSDAIEAYKAAYVLAPSAGLLFNLAQVYRLAGDCGDAAWMYRRFLATEPSEDLRLLAQSHLDRLDACNHASGFRIVEPGDVPPPTTSVVPPAAQLAIHTDVAPPRDGERFEHAGTAVMIGGGAALVAAALFAFDAHEQASAIEDAYAGKGMRTDVMAVDARGQHDATIATVLGIGGVVAVASGAVLYGIGHHYETRRIAIVPQAGGAHVSMSWGF